MAWIHTTQFIHFRCLLPRECYILLRAEAIIICHQVGLRQYHAVHTSLDTKPWTCHRLYCCSCSIVRITYKLPGYTAATAANTPPFQSIGHSLTWIDPACPLSSLRRGHLYQAKCWLPVADQRSSERLGTETIALQFVQVMLEASSRSLTWQVAW